MPAFLPDELVEALNATAAAAPALPADVIDRLRAAVAVMSIEELAA